MAADPMVGEVAAGPTAGEVAADPTDDGLPADEPFPLHPFPVQRCPLRLRP
ncbi:MAG: hypothetical protein ACLTKI_08905 [Lachnospiraceae bacterium]